LYFFAEEIALKRLLYIVFSTICPLFVFAQHYYVKGQVKDEAGNALQNVNIYLHSTGYVYFTGMEVPLEYL